MSVSITLILAVVISAADAPDVDRPAPSVAVTIRWEPGGDGRRSHVDVVGLNPAQLSSLAAAEWDDTHWSRLFRVSVQPRNGSGSASPPPIVGSYRIEGSVLRFQPRFTFDPGIALQACFRPSVLPDAKGTEVDVTSEFIRPKPPPPEPAFVVRVDPVGARCPENLLKLYLHFSRPMSRGQVYARVHLFDESGHRLKLPFLELGEELWDPSGKRITLLFDPGRIKRGLKPREEDGPILEAGKTYTFVIDQEWRDTEGHPLREGYRKTLQVGAPDDVQPSPKRWRVDAPAGNTRGPLKVAFDEPLDRAMLDRAIAVQDSRGRSVPGRTEVNPEGTRWQFRPEVPWDGGRHQLVIDAELEDLAGNSIARPFELDVLRPVTKQTEVRSVTVPFEVVEPARVRND